MSITLERYTAAMHSSDLSDEAHKIGQVDLIKASGMSRGNVAAHYLRLISKATRNDMERMYAALLYVLQLRQIGCDHHQAVTTAMDWLIDPRCKTCTGAGEIERKQLMYACRKCKGVKLRGEPTNPAAQVLIDYVMGCRNEHSGRMSKLLR
jgi:hypothetical protein